NPCRYTGQEWVSTRRLRDRIYPWLINTAEAVFLNLVHAADVTYKANEEDRSQQGSQSIADAELSEEGLLPEQLMGAVRPPHLPCRRHQNNRQDGKQVEMGAKPENEEFPNRAVEKGVGKIAPSDFVPDQDQEDRYEDQKDGLAGPRLCKVNQSQH